MGNVTHLVSSLQSSTGKSRAPVASVAMLHSPESNASAGCRILQNEPNSKALDGGSRTSDAELFKSFRDNGDVSAFEKLFARHKDAVYRYLWMLCGNQMITEDLSQHCWLRLMENTSASGYQPRPGVSLRSFLFTLGRNRYIDEYKRKHFETLSDGIDEQLVLVAAGGSAFESATRQETCDLIEHAIADLPFEQREVLALWVQGFSIQEMTNKVGAPRDTVLSRKKYALKKLKTALKAISPRASDG